MGWKVSEPYWRPACADHCHHSISRLRRPADFGKRHSRQTSVSAKACPRCNRSHTPFRPLRFLVRPNSLPGGDVPADTGVCTDEIIRIYRAVGVDLQKEVHEDMVKNFATYPHYWHADTARPDSNIDHRRVPNLMVFFARNGESLPTSLRAEDYQPGDLVTWDLGGGVPHIGMVVDRRTSGTARNMIVHNIGEGPKIEDVLFRWKITGHYRYFGPKP
jgi:uncharacterized protein YijF (DUF1287 family)